MQAVDQAGNVGYASNKTEGYPATVASDPEITGVVAPSDPPPLLTASKRPSSSPIPRRIFDAYDVEFEWGDGATSAALAEPPRSRTGGRTGNCRGPTPHQAAMTSRSP